MKSFRKMSLTAVAVLAVSTLAFAGATESANGRVESVSGNTVSVALEDGRSWDFEVAEGTRVLAVGAGTRSDALKAMGKKREIGKFVQERDLVTVEYWEQEGTRHIKTLRIHKTLRTH